MHWILVLILLNGERLEQDPYPTRADCQMALTEAARTNYTNGVYRCEHKGD